MDATAVGDIASLAESGVLADLWEELLRSQGTAWGRAVSHSMYPVIREGDRMLVERVSPDRLRFGDIIVFRRSGELVTHRALGRRWVDGREHFLEKGDANRGVTLVPVADILGRVRVIEGPTRIVDVTSGSGRRQQHALALTSYAGSRLWPILESGLFHMRYVGRIPLCARISRAARVLLAEALLWTPHRP